MNINIYDSTQIKDNKLWILSKANLFDYISEMDEAKFDYAIQRKIVKNNYLDKILNSLYNKEPISIITLTYNDKIKFEKDKTISININLKKAEILDGLQRTFRLWAYLKIFEEYKLCKDPNIKNFVKNIRIKYNYFFDYGIITSKGLIKLIDNDLLQNIETIYKNNELILAIWLGLEPDDVVKKMLILNAGHKAVTSRHQFELLFLYICEIIEKEIPEIKVYREKDDNFYQIQKGNRDIGEFVFSSIITSLMSLVQQTPVRISSDMITKIDLLEEEKSLRCAGKIFEFKFIKEYLLMLKSIDEIIIKKYEDLGKKWFVKDTTLSGIMAGIGLILQAQSIDCENLKIEVIKKLNEFKDKIDEQNINLVEFNDQYDNLAGRSLNIGTYIRKINMEFTKQILKDEFINWVMIFQKVSKEVY